MGRLSIRRCAWVMATGVYLSGGASAWGYTLVVRMFQGCPGGITIYWTGAGSSGRQALVIGDEPGATTIPEGLPCTGTVLGVRGHVRLVSPPGFFDVQGGQGMMSGSATPAACGKYLQLVKGGTCETSNIAIIQ